MLVQEVRSCFLVGFIDIRNWMSAPLLRTQVLTLNDIHPGILLKGRITNITSFGVFVDTGIGHDGLIHRRYLDHRMEQLAVGQTVNVVVFSIDHQRGKARISLRLNNE